MIGHAELIRELRERRVLLAADATLPSIATRIAGEPIRGSWWGHPKAHAIFAASTALAHHPDAIAIPLISGKVTFVHRRLWPAVLAVALARARWQTKGLSPKARALLKRIDASGEVEVSGGPIRKLERRLLAKTDEVHTEKGTHAKHAVSWSQWASHAGVEPLKDVAAARVALERAAAGLVAAGAARPALPWDGGGTRVARRRAVP